MIVVCGEALVDLFVGRPTTRGIATEAVAGGSPFNVAPGLARLGAPSAFLSTLSQDAFGTFLQMRLKESGVETRWIRRVPESTTLSVVATGAGGEPHYTFHVAGADRALAPEENRDTAGPSTLSLQEVERAPARTRPRQLTSPRPF